MIYLSVWMYNAEDVGSWTLGVGNLHARNAQIFNDSNEDGDAISFKAYVPAGTYTCKALFQKHTNLAILKIKIDGVVVLTADQYNAGGQICNVIATQAGITVASGGVKTIQAVVDGKNPLSSDYYICLQEIVFYRTA